LKKLSPYAEAGVLGTAMDMELAVGVGSADPKDAVVGVGKADELAFAALVVGRVAWAAGPSAAERGVAGNGTETGLIPLTAALPAMVVAEDTGRMVVPFIICFVAVLGVFALAGPGTGGTGTSGGGKGLWSG
jgi:hypothetical protein